MGSNSSNYPNRANNKTGHLFNSTSFEKAAVLVVTSVSMTSNATKINFVDTTRPKQQIIKNVSRKSDVYMNNSKNTFTQQEVRQKDIDNIKELNRAEIKVVKEEISGVKKDIEKAEDVLSVRIDDLEKRMDRNFKSYTFWGSLVITIVGIIVQIILKFVP